MCGSESEPANAQWVERAIVWRQRWRLREAAGGVTREQSRTREWLPVQLREVKQGATGCGICDGEGDGGGCRARVMDFPKGRLSRRWCLHPSSRRCGCVRGARSSPLAELTVPAHLSLICYRLAGLTNRFRLRSLRPSPFHCKASDADARSRCTRTCPLAASTMPVGLISRKLSRWRVES